MGVDTKWLAKHFEEQETPMNDRELYEEGLLMDLEKAKGRIEELEAENHLLKTSGIIEVAARNTNVMEYIKHWDDKVEAAEAALEKAVEAMGEAIYLLTFEELTGGKDD